MCMELRVSCAHPNGVCADKTEIRIKFIPLIGAGLSQQDPWGLLLSDGLLSRCGQLTFQFLKEPWMQHASHLGEGVYFILSLILSLFNMKFCQSEGQEDISQEQNAHFTLPGALIWIQAWGGGVGLWRLRPKTGSILLWQQEMQHRKTWWGSFLSSLEGFFPAWMGLGQHLSHISLLWLIFRPFQLSPFSVWALKNRRESGGQTLKSSSGDQK